MLIRRRQDGILYLVVSGSEKQKVGRPETFSQNRKKSWENFFKNITESRLSGQSLNGKGCNRFRICPYMFKMGWNAPKCYML